MFMLTLFWVDTVTNMVVFIRPLHLHAHVQGFIIFRSVSEREATFFWVLQKRVFNLTRLTVV